MKIKLTHLIIASLISLSVVFSTASNVFSGSRLSKVRNHYPNTTSGSGYSMKEDTSPNTTSASGFDKGQITQKNGNGFIHLEKYDPQKYGIQHFDLEITVETYLFNKVKLTIKNLGTMDIDGEFYIHFKLVDHNIFDHDGFLWFGKYEIPDPLSTTTHIKDIFAWGNEYWPNWGLSVAANVDAFNLYNELTYHNNYDHTTHY